MFILFSFLAGVLNAVTVLQNGQLSAFYGKYSATVIIHLVGLLSVCVLRFTQRHRLPPKQKAPLWMYLGGVVGVGTVVLNNMAFGGVSVTAIIGLSLLGQSIASIAVDQFGLFGAPRSPFFKGKLLGVAAVLAGALVMVLPLNGANMAAVLMALCTGFTIVTARSMNARLADHQGHVRSTTMNYITGLSTSVLVLLALGRGETMFHEFAWAPNWFIYFGGTLGVCLITMLNQTVNRVPALMLTLLQFTGQIFTSLLLDAALQGRFSVQSAVGGLLVAIGLALNTWMTNRRKLS